MPTPAMRTAPGYLLAQKREVASALVPEKLLQDVSAWRCGRLRTQVVLIEMSSTHAPRAQQYSIPTVNHLSRVAQQRHDREALRRALPLVPADPG